MSHFDDIFPGIVNGLAVIGFSTLCMLFVFFLLMARDALRDRREQVKAEQTTKDEADAAIKEVEAMLGLEHH